MSKVDWGWLEARLPEVQAMTAEAAAEMIEGGLAAIDERLGAEVSDVEGTRHVVVTAGGDDEAFALVRQLVAAAPSLRHWSFAALRPAKGFDFTVRAGSVEFVAKSLSFQPIPAAEAPMQLAIRLLVPNPQLEEWAEIGLQLIEIGIGEEAAARIAYLEIDRRNADSENVFAIESLAGYVERHAPPTR